jgi:hypothetical protein
VLLKELGSSLPSAADSAHFQSKQQATKLFDDCIAEAGQQTVKFILGMLQSEDMLVRRLVPMSLMKLLVFVKGEIRENMHGKINPDGEGSKVLKFLPFTERSFLVYVADVAAAVCQRGSIELESELVYPFSSEMSFLRYVDVVLDANRCSVPQVIQMTLNMR